MIFGTGRFSNRECLRPYEFLRGCRDGSFTWRRLAEQGALTATQAEEEVVPASAFRAQQEQIRELQRLLGKKTLEAEILKEALDVAASSKKAMLRSLSLPRDGSQ